ncbi:hypothetical protein [Fibrobacter succinogenes]|uniref:hypothetical protein n=1 Tax=Fibrobacter succinogenes TaxID=833 RepID=UPI001567BE34|nr:hypothetical protein [Fibrobacter succinogenes]
MIAKTLNFALSGAKFAAMNEIFGQTFAAAIAASPAAARAIMGLSRETGVCNA